MAKKIIWEFIVMSEKAVIAETRIAPMAKKNIIKVGIINSAITNTAPIKNHIKYVLIKSPFIFEALKVSLLLFLNKNNYIIFFEHY